MEGRKSARVEVGAALGTATDDETALRVFAAAMALIRERGIRNVSVSELARRAAVSRPTIYRRWSGADDIVRNALVQHVQRLAMQAKPSGETRAEIVESVLRFCDVFRRDPVYAHLLTHEPEAFTRYTFERVGRSQLVLIDWLSGAITAAQAGGTARAGDPVSMAVMCLLIGQSALLSHGSVSTLIDDEHWRTELWHALDGHLRP